MGIPVIVAPSEAEGASFVYLFMLHWRITTIHTAQCASLAREGAVYAAGSEDMDTLTFGGSILYRHLTFSEAKKAPIMEVNLERALEGLEMNMSTVGFFLSLFYS
jgi:flap endonuclease-1